MPYAFRKRIDAEGEMYIISESVTSSFKTRCLILERSVKLLITKAKYSPKYG
jgi:hypothetical protein